ncbi:urea transporter [Pseudomonas delhiensis]|uniref:Urea transporter n=1 Tax=Pseudomonas delhiensis TaxID=366289 RepID=A0A239NLE7_9PSED|nr:urea transporter [Pseudomonas delhiensis]SDL06495.1 urea transporter [Pseudomonas delhiensis]SNT55731.1 urea transporter [Pseudomonas delhiensis]
MRPLPLLTLWLRGFSQVFLQPAPLFGLLCLALIGACAPTLLPGALLGASAGPAFARLLRCRQADIDDGLYGYNAVLIGLLLPLKFAWSPLLVALVLFASLASVALQRLLLRASRRRHGLPPYTLAFVLLGWALPALPLQPAAPLAGLADLPLPAFLAATARAFGQVIFLDAPPAGALIFLGLLLGAPRAATWALFGAVMVLPVAVFAGIPQDAVQSGLLGMNSALAALALALRGPAPFAPLAGAVLALLLQQAMAALGIPFMTAPFIFACLLVLLGERLLHPTSRRAPLAGN